MFQARRRHGRNDSDDMPRHRTGRRARSLHREHHRGRDHNDHDAKLLASRQSTTSAARASVAEAKQFFDALFHIAISQQGPQQADAEITTTPAEQL